MDSFVVAQILSAVAAVIFISSIQFKDKRHIIYFFIASTLIAMSALALMGARSGLMMNFVTLLPTLYIYRQGKHRRRLKPATAWVFWALLLVGWLAVYSGPVDILALIGSSIYVFSLFQRHENNIRGMLVVNQIAWVSYNLVIGLYTGAFFGVCFIVSDIVAIKRYHKHRRWHRRSTHHWWK
ncbi:YgjV family protein [Candidatus Saccharibacteria bacterium]|nr:YgjV family protein [Candidatus Saccharibacteria bacterium]